MSVVRVLHITDFHLHDPSGVEENLRVANYKPFIKDLASSLRENGVGPIDFILTTGDYVNLGKVSNYSHCESVLCLLAEELDFESEKVLTCVGNHDYKRDLDIENPVDARLAYRDFAKKFNGYKVLHHEDLFQILFDEVTGLYIVIFDSTLGAAGKNVPSIIATSELDRVYSKIEQIVPEDKPLFVLSHYPMDKPYKSSLLMEESSWPEKHIWKSGNTILRKLNSLRRDALTVYFHGDGHSPDFWSYSKHHHAFMTGMIGGRHEPSFDVKKIVDSKEISEKKFYHKLTEFKVVEFEESGECQVKSFSYHNDGFNFDVNTGEWRVHNSGPRYTPKVQQVLDKRAAKSEESREDIDEESGELEKRQFDDIRTELISGSIESRILEVVEKDKLYSFGVHRTSGLYTSLGWVDIDSLMNNRNVFSRCVEKGNDWLKSLFVGDEFCGENSLLIGLDFWGSCIAVQVSVLSAISNVCIATKSKGRYNIESERLETILKPDHDFENIVLFSDVVSTGHSISHVAELIRKNSKSENLKLISISVISDTEQKRSVQLEGFYKVATFCSKLRIPVMENLELPDDRYVRPRLDIS